MKANDMHYFSNLFDKVLNQINLRNTASHWLSLYEYITMHVPLNVKNAIVTFCMGTFVKFPFQNRPDIYPPPKKRKYLYKLVLLHFVSQSSTWDQRDTLSIVYIHFCTDPLWACEQTHLVLITVLQLVLTYSNLKKKSHISMMTCPPEATQCFVEIF